VIPCGICTRQIGPGDRVCPGCGRPVSEGDQARLRPAGASDARATRRGVTVTRVLVVLSVSLAIGLGAAYRAIQEVAHNRRVGAVTAASPVSVPDLVTVDRGSHIDTGRRWLVTCALEAVAFRAQDEGWVTDACGRAFHTTDAGDTFTALASGPNSLADVGPDRSGDDASVMSPRVSRIEWLSGDRGVAFGERAPDALAEGTVRLTTDGGATWRPVPAAPLGQARIYTSAHVGQTIWACGSSGTIFRSRDGGASFARTRGTPFDDDDRCTALSFTDERNGWAGGDFGTLHVTHDGGDRWRRVGAPMPNALTGATTLSGRNVRALRVAGIVAPSAREAWVRMREQPSDGKAWTLFTADAGARWVEARPTAVMDVLLEGGVAWGDGGAVVARDARLRFVAGTDLVRETPIAGRDAGPVEVLRGSLPLQPGRLLGYTDQALMQSFDDGRSWATMIRIADKRIAGIAHPDGDTLVEREDAQLFGVRWASGGDGYAYELVASTQPEFDRYRIVRVQAERAGVPRPPGPLSDLAAAAVGSLEVELALTGCDVHRRSSVRIAWDDRESTYTDGNRNKQVLPRADRQRLLRDIAAGVERADDGEHGCTTSIDAELTWRLGATPPVKARFSESHCGSEGAPPPTGPAHRVRAALLPLVPAP